MSNFKPTLLSTFPKRATFRSEDSLYWRKFEFPVTVKEYGAIDYIDCSSAEEHYFAVTSTSRVLIYNPQNNAVARNINRFKLFAYGGTFRNDGQLLCAGSDEGHVKLFNVSSGSLLRVFKGHTSPVHRCKFRNDGTHLISFGDDKCVAVWDIPSEKEIMKFNDSEDYLRSGCTNMTCNDMVISGGYDHKIRMYDLRAGECTMMMDHGAPVESLVCLPSGGILLSTGGTCTKVWNLLSGGQLLASLSQHHKTITTVATTHSGRYILSGSLDTHVKVYDTTYYSVVQTIDFPSPVLSLAVLPDDKALVVGMTDGLLSIQHRKVTPIGETPPKKKIMKRRARWNFRSQSAVTIGANDLVVKQDKNVKLSHCDNHLRKFEFSKALDVVLREYVMKKAPQVTVSVMLELLRRQALHSALAGRDDKSVFAIVRFLTQNLSDVRFTRTLVDVANVLLDIYGPLLEKRPELTKAVRRLHDHLQVYCRYIEELLCLQGSIDMILACERLNCPSDCQPRESALLSVSLAPSSNANSKLVVDIE